MNFKEVVDFLNHEDMTETVVSPSDPSLLSTLEALIGKAYRFTRTFGKTPEETMRLILWTLFYFVQQEHRLTAEDEESVLIAMAAAENSFAYCGEQKEEESK